MAKLIRPYKRLVATEAWSGGATIDIELPKDQLVSRYLVFVYTTAKSAATSTGVIRCIQSASLIDADGNPIKSGHGFMHNMYNGLYSGRGVRPVGERNAASATAPQYALFEFRFELFDGDTRFLFPAFAMHSLKIQIVCEALATVDTHTTTTFAATIQVFEHGYLKSSLPKAFLTRQSWHTIINRQKKWYHSSTGDDQRTSLWRGTHMRRMVLLTDTTAATHLYANCTIVSVDKVRTFRNGTMITDEIFRVMYLTDCMDYGKALPAEAAEAALIIAATVIDDHFEAIISYEASVGEQKSLLNLVGADSFEIGLDVDEDTWALLYSEEIV